MSMDMSRYPEKWREISLRIRERDGWKCTVCGLANGLLIVRSSIDAARYLIISEPDFIYHWPDGLPIRMSELPEEYDGKWSRVTLTVHHKGVDRPDGTPGDRHDKMDCRDENLCSLCQRDHFIADIDIHIIHARQSRLAKKRARIAAAGQLDLFGVGAT